jgi:hypothetical protein
MFFLFPDPHFKKRKHKARIITYVRWDSLLFCALKECVVAMDSYACALFPDCKQQCVVAMNPLYTCNNTFLPLSLDLLCCQSTHTFFALAESSIRSVM